MYIETRLRSLTKSVTYRLIATLTTTGLVFGLTHRASIAATVGGAELLLKIFIQYFHERAWNQIRFGKLPVKSSVIWLTGLSGSGKNSLAEGLTQALQAKGLKAQLLEGAEIRHIFPEAGYSPEERDLHVRRVGHLASTLEKQGIFAVASFVSPSEASRDAVRQLCTRFVEVHVSTPLEKCEDPQGIYERARRGELKDVVGIDLPYESPRAPAFRFDLSVTDRQAAIKQLIDGLKIG